jgi:3-phenylpropionate/trans-cinnamate dioxygenase ferredoxin subunit
MSEYRAVAKASGVPPGDMHCVTLDGDEIVIANAGGTFYAFSNICPHEGRALCERILQGDKVTCPWHDAQFDIRTGKALAWITDDPVRIFELRRDGDSIEIRK